MKMKWMLIALLSFSMVACGDGDKEQKEGQKKENKDQAKDEGQDEQSSDDDAEEIAMSLDQTLDLSQYDMPLKLKVPEGTTVDEKSYGIYIKNGEGFNFEPNVDFYETVAERKKELEANDLNKLKKYIKDTDNGYIAETEVMGKTEYHVFYLIKGEGFTVSIENVKGRPYSLPEAKLMWKAFETAEALPMSK